MYTEKDARDLEIIKQKINYIIEDIRKVRPDHKQVSNDISCLIDELCMVFKEKANDISK